MPKESIGVCLLKWNCGKPHKHENEIIAQFGAQIAIEE